VVVDHILENRHPIKSFLDNKKYTFTIRTLDELLSVLNLKGEIEFIQKIFYIFGENISKSHDYLINTYGKEFCKKKVNFREVFDLLAFFRMDNFKAKVSSKIFINKNKNSYD